MEEYKNTLRKSTIEEIGEEWQVVYDYLKFFRRNHAKCQVDNDVDGMIFWAGWIKVMEDRLDVIDEVITERIYSQKEDHYEIEGNQENNS